MTISSHQISGMMAAQTSMFSGQMAMSQQLAYPMMHHHQPGMGPPPAPASFSGEFDYGARIEQGVARMGSMATNVGLPVMGAGLGIAGAMGMMGPLGRAFDPTHFLGRGFSAGGFGGAMRALPMAIPHMALLGAAGSMVSAYGKAATGGMQDQIMVNNMLRSNFDFTGGGGFMGRGFSQQQMGQIGGLMHQTSRMDAFSPGMGELSSLVAQGKSMDMFTGVRDVQEFSKKFKEMISSLKTIQQELGGSLQEAMNFAQQARSSGIYNTADRGMFAQTVRRTADIAGVSQDTVFQTAQFGSQLAQHLGGRASQGAMGGTRAIQQVGAAVQGGFLTPEMLSEATGGLTGDAATSAFAQNLMSRVAQRSRGGYERFSVFALANQEGTGIDSTMMGRYLSGDMSMQEIRSRAYKNAHGMGRAKAIRNEGMLRAGAIQEGGALFGVRRIMDQLGDRAMMHDDDTLHAVLRRRYRMGRGEADAVTSMMRNMPEIGLRMAIDAESSDEEQRLARDTQRNRSFEGMKRQIGHYVAEATGIADAREWGRGILTKFTSGMERFVNDLFGVVNQELSAGGKETVRRVIMGRGTSEDAAKIEAAMASLESFDGSRQLKGGLLQSSTPEGRVLQALGYDVSSMQGRDGYIEYQRSIRDVNRLISGQHSDEQKARFAAMQGSGADLTLLRASAVTGGDLTKMSEYLTSQGLDSREYMGYAAAKGMGFDELTGRLETGGKLGPDTIAGRRRGGLEHSLITGGMAGIGAASGLAGAKSLGWIGAKLGGKLGTLGGGAVGTVVGATAGALGGAAIGYFGADKILGALGYDYTGVDGAAQYLEDSLDKHTEAEYRRRVGESPLGQYDSDLQREFKYRGKVEEDHYEAAFRNASARGLLSDILEGATPGEKLSEDQVKQFSEKLMELGLDTDPRNAILNIIEAGKEGGLTSNMLGAIQQGIDPLEHMSKEELEAHAAMSRRLFKMSGSYEDISTKLQGVAGAEGVSSTLQDLSLNIFKEGGIGGVKDAIDQLAALPQEQREEAYRAMGNDAQAMGLRMGAQERVRALANLSGGGRRGQWGARDSMFQHLSGGMSDQLGIVIETEDGGYQQINDRQGRNLLQQGLSNLGNEKKVTKKQQAALDAYRRKYQDMGLSDEDIDEIMGLQSTVMKDGKIDAEEAAKILDAQSKERTVTYVDDEGNTQQKQSSIAEIVREMQKERARDADPLSNDRNEHLKRIEGSSAEAAGYLRRMVEDANKPLHQRVWSGITGSKVTE